MLLYASAQVRSHAAWNGHVYRQPQSLLLISWLSLHLLQVQEISIDYTSCKSEAPRETFAPIPDDRISTFFTSSADGAAPAWKREERIVSFGPGANVETTLCSLQFEIPEDMGPPVFLYYRLDNFYQNHRRYVQSLDKEQLEGQAVSSSTLGASKCEPLAVDDDTNKVIYPCGLIANSQFNDTFFLPVLLNPEDSDAANKTYNMTNRGIAWDSDRELYGQTEYNFDEVVPPPYWRTRYPNGYNEDFPFPNLQDDEQFQVWMRTAGLPHFSKLALRNDDETMTAGRYQLDIRDCMDINYVR